MKFPGGFNMQQMMKQAQQMQDKMQKEMEMKKQESEISSHRATSAYHSPVKEVLWRRYYSYLPR